METQEIVDAFLKFKVIVSCGVVTNAPQLTRYQLIPGLSTTGRMTRVSEIYKVLQDVKVYLGVNATIASEDSVLWFDVYNDDRETVIDIPHYKDGVYLGLGITTNGEPLGINLADPATPHVIIAGATGSGKSVTINYIITWILRNHFYGFVKLLLFDLKNGVEFADYSNVKHLYAPIVEDADTAYNHLVNLLQVIETRYTKLRNAGFRSIDETATIEYPHIILVIDEYAELVAARPDASKLIVRIAAIGRAAGVHIILATQRPSVKIISGDIKANFPVRIGFHVPTNTDSRVIIDRVGCEDLRGYGDGIIMLPSGYTRFQAAMLPVAKIRSICAQVQAPRKFSNQQYLQDLHEFANEENQPSLEKDIALPSISRNKSNDIESDGYYKLIKWLAWTIGLPITLPLFIFTFGILSIFVMNKVLTIRLHKPVVKLLRKSGVPIEFAYLVIDIIAYMILILVKGI